MFRQIKSAILWTLIYKFRKRLSIVAVLISIILLFQWIYGDIVEYLKLTGKIGYLNIVLPLKWIIILFNIGLSTYLLLTLFKQDQDKKARIQKNKKNETEKRSKPSSEKKEKDSLTDREKEFMTKKLRSEAEILMER
ncbi:MAG: hypothetical protein IE885_08400 [Campylobacterales bacterium]|nr:hypothetical protein [Campylobacterales bacterium]